MKKGHDLFAYVFLALVFVSVLSGCGKETRDPELQYNDPKAAKLTFSDMPWYDFGDRDVSTVSQKVIQIANTGGMSATDFRGSFYLSVHFAFKDGAFPGTGGNCGETLKAGASCLVVVTFSPQYQGQFEQPISILFHDGFIEQKATGPYLRGRGL